MIAMKKVLFYIFCFSFGLAAAYFLKSKSKTDSPKAQDDLATKSSPAPNNRIETMGRTIQSRFVVPKNFERFASAKNSFAHYLQNLPLKPVDTKVRYYNGELKSNQSLHAAVLDIDVEKRDLQQCADAVMRLRAEHLLEQKDYENIHFNYTNGFKADYNKWRQGYRIKVNGNNVSWTKTAQSSDDYKSFRKYMTQVFSYAGTLSLEKELNSVSIEDMEIGDVFIQGGSPGHAVIVVDMAKHKTTNEKLFLLAQSYMPAQDIHVLKNLENSDWSPWYSSNFGEILQTPEWTFKATDLKRF